MDTQKPDKRLNPKQQAMIEALRGQLGVISSACKIVGIERKTHYNWLLNPVYKQAVEDINEFTIDFAENALYKLIAEKNVVATIFFLKTRAKSRGYIEKADNYNTFNHTGPEYKLEITMPKEMKNVSNEVEPEC